MKRFPSLVLTVGTSLLATPASADSGWSIQWISFGGAPFAPQLKAVNMPTENDGIAVGGFTGRFGGAFAFALWTEDGGVHWRGASTPPGSGALNNVKFTDLTTAVAVGMEGTVLRTTNRGATWTRLDSGTVRELAAVSFDDGNTGTAVGQAGTILRTTDGGLTWMAQSSGTTNSLDDVFSLDAKTAVAVGGGGTILQTIDGGVTWTPRSSGTTTHLRAVSFADANSGTVVGDAGTILRTADGGVSWSPQLSGTTASLLSVAYAAEADTVAVGGIGTILRTTDGGATWRQQELPLVVEQWPGWSGVSFRGGNGIAVGGLFILRTLTGGEPVTCTVTIR